MDLDPLPAADTLALITSAIQMPHFGISQIIALLIALIALLISGYISGSEIAFFSFTSSQLEEMEEGDNTSQRIAAVMKKPERLLATILIANNLVNVTIVVLTNFALGPVFSGMHPALSFILQSVILTFLILLFGEILPKLYCSSYPLKWARFAIHGINFFYHLLYPLSGLLVRSTSIVHKVVTKQTHNISADELSQALDITEVKTEEEKEMLQGILEFGDTTASEIMTPRISMVGVQHDASFDEVLRTVIDTGYSRLPVYVDSQDNIKGILYSRDLLPYIGKPLADSFDWHTLLRKPYYVPEQKMIDDLLEDFRRRKIHLAIVVDEFGGTQGIVTMEDVLEEIVGDINDEYDDEANYYTRISDDTYNFEGRTPLTDFFRITGIDEEPFAEVTEDADTVAGMILAIKGDFPKDKEPLVYANCRFLVLKVADHRIAAVRVKVMPQIQEA